MRTGAMVLFSHFILILLYIYNYIYIYTSRLLFMYIQNLVIMIYQS